MPGQCPGLPRSGYATAPHPQNCPTLPYFAWCMHMDLPEWIYQNGVTCTNFVVHTCEKVSSIHIHFYDFEGPKLGVTANNKQRLFNFWPVCTVSYFVHAS